MISALRYALARWWLKRRIALCHYRREELRRIIEREMDMIAFEEAEANAALRELQSRQLTERLVTVKP